MVGGPGGGDPTQNQRAVTVFMNGLDMRLCQRPLLIMAGGGQLQCAAPVTTGSVPDLVSSFLVAM